MTIKNFISPLRILVGLIACSAGCLAQGDKALTSAPAATDTAAKTTAAPGFNDRSPRYHLQPGDTFDLNFDLSPEFNQTAVAVQPDGFVTLRSVGDVKVAGQTIPQLTETIKQAYSKILNNPPISVNLKEFEKPYFVAGGQVSKPGKYELHGSTTLTQAVAIAGGFQSNAKHSQVLLFHRVDDQWTEAKLIDVKKMQKKHNLSEDPVLHPGDMLVVPQNTYSKIDRFIPNLSMGTYLPIQVP
jgi:protein involved in polysaccharide export with SLBB domain